MMYELLDVTDLGQRFWMWRIRNPEGGLIEIKKWMREGTKEMARREAMSLCGKLNRALSKDRLELGDGKSRQKENQEQMGRRHHAMLMSRGLVKG